MIVVKYSVRRRKHIIKDGDGVSAFYLLLPSSRCIVILVALLEQRRTVDWPGRVGLMKLSEACSVVDDGRACLAANGEAPSVISGA